jgi:hypothetical protein
MLKRGGGGADAVQPCQFVPLLKCGGLHMQAHVTEEVSSHLSLYAVLEPAYALFVSDLPRPSSSIRCQ